MLIVSRKNVLTSNFFLLVSVIFYWITLSLIILSFILAYDPLGNFSHQISPLSLMTNFFNAGGSKYQKLRDGNDNIDPNTHHELMHNKVTKQWIRRLKFTFCCVDKGEFGDEAFTQSAELFSHLFRGTDLVPSG